MAGPGRRICLCTDSREPSGVGAHMLALAAGLDAEWEVTLAAPGAEAGLALLDRAAGAGLRVWRLPGEECQIAAGFALVHVHAGIGWEGHGLAQSARAGGVRVVVRTDHLPYLLTEAGQRAAHDSGLTRVDRVICVSDAVAASHVAAGIAPGQLVTIRNGIAAPAARRSRAEMRAALGLPQDAPVLLTVARLTAQKGHSTLLEAARRILATRPETRLLLVGTGPEEGALRRLAAGVAPAGAVRFLGRREDVPDLLAAADALVLPSLFEGLPLVVLEAMEAGLPVVATRIGGTDEAVADGLTGWLVPPGDAAGLARAVLALLADPAAGRAAGRAGRERFEREFHAARMARETQLLYADCFSSAADLFHSPGNRVQRVRIGFIGAGGIAERHLGVLERFEDVEIAAFADPRPGRAAEIAGRFGARGYASHAEMLAGPALDAVYICVPPFAHGAPERDVLRRGLPFFVEKPLAADLATAEAVAGEVAAAGIVTGVGYHWRYLDTVEQARALLAEAPAQLVCGYWLDGTPPPPWWRSQSQSGGQMVEQATHILDLARYLVGEVEQVFGLAGHLERAEFPDLDVATASAASLKFASGAIGSIAATCVLRWGHRIGLHLFGQGLAIELTDHDIMIDRGQGRPVRAAEGDPVWREDRDFIDAVKGGPNRIRCCYHEALRTHRLAIGRSAALERPVLLAAQGREMERV